jgi:PAS domain S-box-containing protein
MSAGEGISIHAGDTFIDINQAWEEMFGFDRSIVLGTTPFDYSPHLQPDGRISSERGWEHIRAAQAGEDQLFSWRHIRADGTEFDAEIFMTVIEIGDEEVMISFVRDLTERKKADEAAREERQRLAHELHDAVSQTLFSASMITQTLERNWKKDPQMVRDHLKELQVLTQGALAEMRNLLVELRPGSLERTPMPELLQQLVDGFSGRTKTSISLEIQNHNPLPSEVRFVFFRLAQESLNNIIKHARASDVQVNYTSQPDHAQLTIVDDGQGFDQTQVAPGHFGLEIMKERADKINADINISSKLGKGTSVNVNWKP